MYSQYGQLIRQGFSGMFSHSGVTRSQAASIPYATLGYRIEDGNQSLLVLATDTGGEQLWTASNHVVFQTRDGRITRTVGLAHNLGALTPRSGEALPSPFTALKQPFSSTRLVDLTESGVYSLALTCRSMPSGPQSITILGQAIATQRVDETCENRAMGWRFTDTYWLDPATGMAWRSIQHVAPKGGKIQTEILRPPG